MLPIQETTLWTDYYNVSVFAYTCYYYGIDTLNIMNIEHDEHNTLLVEVG